MNHSLDPPDVPPVAADIRRYANELPGLYEWLHSAGFVARRGGHPGSGGDTGLNDLAKLLGATTASREKLATTSRLLLAARDSLLGARNTLHELGTMIDAGADRTLDELADRRRQRPEEWPGIRASLEAKARRVNAGEGIADLAIVREIKPRYDRLEREHATARSKAQGQRQAPRLASLALSVRNRLGTVAEKADRWTVERDRLICDAVAAGGSLADVAEVVGMPVPDVRPIVEQQKRAG